MFSSLINSRTFLHILITLYFHGPCDSLPTCLGVHFSQQVRVGGLRQKEGEQSDAGSCAGGKLGCGSSGTGGCSAKLHWPMDSGSVRSSDSQHLLEKSSSADYVPAGHTESAELVR